MKRKIATSNLLSARGKVMYIFVVFAEKQGESYKVEIPCLGESFECPTDSKSAMLDQVAVFIKCRCMKCLLMDEKVPQAGSLDFKNNKQCRHTLAVKVDLSENNLFSVTEVQHILGVSQPRVSHLIRDKRLVALKKGHYRLITRESLEAYLRTPRKAGRPSQSLASQLEETTAIQQ